MKGYDDETTEKERNKNDTIKGEEKKRLLRRNLKKTSRLWE